MAKAVKKKGLLREKYGAQIDKAVAAHGNDETEFGANMAELPEGIENGVARLTKCYFAQYKSGDNEGEVYFRAEGTVLMPANAPDGTPILGLSTSIMEPIHETPSRKRETVEDHIAWVLNEMRKLGFETDDNTDPEEAAEFLQEAGPTFRFRTWKGEATDQYPNPRTNHQWQGAVEIEDAEDVAATAVTEKASTPSRKAPVPPVTTEESEVEPEEESEAVEAAEEEPSSEETEFASMSLAEVAQLADGGDDEAGVWLEGQANEKGVDSESVETWAEVAELLDSSEDVSKASSDDEPVADWEPQKGETYFYKPPRARKAVEVEVTAVFPGKQTVNLKGDSKTFRGVSWESLMDEA